MIERERDERCLRRAEADARLSALRLLDSIITPPRRVSPTAPRRVPKIVSPLDSEVRRVAKEVVPQTLDSTLPGVKKKPRDVGAPIERLRRLAGVRDPEPREPVTLESLQKRA